MKYRMLALFMALSVAFSSSNLTVLASNSVPTEDTVISEVDLEEIWAETEVTEETEVDAETEMTEEAEVDAETEVTEETEVSAEMEATAETESDIETESAEETTASTESAMTESSAVLYFQETIEIVPGIIVPEPAGESDWLGSMEAAVYSGSYGAQLTGRDKEFYDVLTANYADNVTTGEAAVEFSEPITFEAELIWEDGNAVLAENDSLLAADRILTESMQNAADAFFYDHPEVFWARSLSCSMELQVVGTVGTYTNICVIPSMVSAGESTAAALVEMFESRVNEAAGSISDTCITRYDQVKAAHDYICDTLTYSESALAHTSGAAFAYDQLAVCEGYAKAFKVLCDELGIPCVLVSGLGVNSTDGNSSEAHMWAYVQMEDGYWYLVDPTWDDQTEVAYDYFLAGSADNGFYRTIGEDHLPSGDFSGRNYMSFAYPVLETEGYEVTDTEGENGEDQIQGGQSSYTGDYWQHENEDGQTITGLDLMPSAVGKTYFTADEIAAILEARGESFDEIYTILNPALQTAPDWNETMTVPAAVLDTMYDYLNGAGGPAQYVKVAFEGADGLTTEWRIKNLVPVGGLNAARNDQTLNAQLEIREGEFGREVYVSVIVPEFADPMYDESEKDYLASCVDLMFVCREESEIGQKLIAALGSDSRSVKLIAADTEGNYGIEYGVYGSYSVNNGEIILMLDNVDSMGRFGQSMRIDLPLTQGTKNCAVDVREKDGIYYRLDINCADGSSPQAEILRILESFAGYSFNVINIIYNQVQTAVLPADVINVILDKELLQPREAGDITISPSLFVINNTDGICEEWQFEDLSKAEHDVAIDFSVAVETIQDGQEILVTLGTEENSGYPEKLTGYYYTTTELNTEILAGRDSLSLYRIDPETDRIIGEQLDSIEIWDNDENVTLAYYIPPERTDDDVFAAYSGNTVRLAAGYNEDSDQFTLWQLYLTEQDLLDDLDLIYEENRGLIQGCGQIDVNSTEILPKELIAFCQEKGLDLNYEFGRWIGFDEENNEDIRQNFNLWMGGFSSAEGSDISFENMTVEMISAGSEDIPETLRNKAVVQISHVPQIPDCRDATLNVNARRLTEGVAAENGSLYLWHDGGDELTFVGSAGFRENDDGWQGISLPAGEFGAGTYYLSGIRGVYAGSVEDWGNIENGEWISRPALVIREGDAGCVLTENDILQALSMHEEESFHYVEIQYDTAFTTDPVMYGSVLTAADRLLFRTEDENNRPEVQFAVNDGNTFRCVNVGGLHDSAYEENAQWTLSAGLRNEKGILTAEFACTQYPADHVSIHMNWPAEGYNVLNAVAGSGEIRTALIKNGDVQGQLLAEGNYGIEQNQEQERVWLNFWGISEIPENTQMQICRLNEMEFRLGDEGINTSSFADVPSKAKWFSADPDTASIDAKGNLAMYHAGDTVISAVAGKDTVLYRLHIRQAQLAGVVLNRDRMELTVGNGEFVQEWDEQNDRPLSEYIQVNFGLYPEFVPIEFDWDYDRYGDPNGYFNYEVTSGDDVISVFRAYEMEESYYDEASDRWLRNYRTDENGSRIPIRDCAILVKKAGRATIKVTFAYEAEEGQQVLLEDTCDVIVKERAENILPPENIYYLIGAQQTVGDIALPEGYEWVSPKQKLTVKSTGVVSLPAVYTQKDGFSYTINIPVAAVKLRAPVIEYAYGVYGSGHGEGEVPQDPLETGLVYAFDAGNKYYFRTEPVIDQEYLLYSSIWSEAEQTDIEIINPEAVLTEIVESGALNVSWTAAKNRYPAKATESVEEEYLLQLPDKAFKGTLKLTAGYEYRCLANGKEKVVKLANSAANITVSQKAAFDFFGAMQLELDMNVNESEYQADGQVHYVDFNQYKEGVIRYSFLNEEGQLGNTPAGAKITVKSSDSKVITVGKAVIDADRQEQYGIDVYSVPIMIKKTGPVTLSMTANDEQKTTKEIKLYVTDYQVKFSATTVNVNRNYNAENGAFGEGAFETADTSASTLINAALPEGTRLTMFGFVTESGQGFDVANERFGINWYGDSSDFSFFLTVIDKNMPVGTYQETIVLEYEESEAEESDKRSWKQFAELTVNVTSTVPKFTVKQTANVNLAYQSWAEESRGELKITASNFRNNISISEVYLEGVNGSSSPYETVDDIRMDETGFGGVSSTVAVKLRDDITPASVMASEKANLVIKCNGYEEIRVPVTIKSVNKAEGIKVAEKKVTVYPQAGNMEAVFTLLTADKQRFDLRESVESDEGIEEGTSIEYITGSGPAFTVTQDAESDRLLFRLDENVVLQKKTTAKVTFSVKQPHWRKDVILNASIIVDPMQTPGLELSEKTLTLNKNEAFNICTGYTYLYRKGSTELLSGEYEIRITPADEKTRKANKKGLNVFYDFDYEQQRGSQAIRAEVFSRDLVTAGTYKYKIAQLMEGRKLAETVLTVNVVDQAPEKAIKMTQNGSLLLADVNGSELTVTPQLGKIQGEIHNIWADSAWLDNWYDNGKLYLKLRANALLPASGQYTVPLHLEIGTEFFGFSLQYNLKIKVKDGTFSVFLKKLPSMLSYDHFYSGTLYSGYQGMLLADLPTYSSGQTVYEAVNMELLNNQNLFICEYDEEYQGHTIRLADASVKTGTYKLQLKVTYKEIGYSEHGAEHTSMPAEKTITYTVKVK